MLGLGQSLTSMPHNMRDAMGILATLIDYQCRCKVLCKSLPHSCSLIHLLHHGRQRPVRTIGPNCNEEHRKIEDMSKRMVHERKEHSVLCLCHYSYYCDFHRFVSKAGAGSRGGGDRQFCYVNGRPVDLPKVSLTITRVICW